MCVEKVKNTECMTKIIALELLIKYSFMANDKDYISNKGVAPVVNNNTPQPV